MKDNKAVLFDDKYLYNTSSMVHTFLVLVGARGILGVVTAGGRAVARAGTDGAAVLGAAGAGG